MKRVWETEGQAQTNERGVPSYIPIKFLLSPSRESRISRNEPLAKARKNLFHAPYDTPT